MMNSTRFLPADAGYYRVHQRRSLSSGIARRDRDRRIHDARLAVLHVAARV